jgi:nucleoid DNA-binding protein
MGFTRTSCEGPSVHIVDATLVMIARTLAGGQRIEIPAQRGVAFSAGSELKAAVRGEKARERGR